jgi:hypothetical protein
MMRGGARFIPPADAPDAFRADARPMTDFERLRGKALTGADGRATLRYVRERESQREARTSSRAMQMSELAAAAREKHRGLFARLAAAPPREA